jgi:hypothetical protein
MLSLLALVRNVFPTNEYLNKETGVITPPGHKVQLEYEALVNEAGEKKIILDDFNVRNLGDAWRKAIGKRITVPVGTMSDLGTKNITLYIQRGAIPTLVAQ